MRRAVAKVRVYELAKELGIESKVVMAKCDGSTLQKWNAPPDLLESSPLSNIREN